MYLKDPSPSVSTAFIVRLSKRLHPLNALAPIVFALDRSNVSNHAPKPKALAPTVTTSGI